MLRTPEGEPFSTPLVRSCAPGAPAPAEGPRAGELQSVAVEASEPRAVGLPGRGAPWIWYAAKNFLVKANKLAFLYPERGEQNHCKSWEGHPPIIPCKYLSGMH